MSVSTYANFVTAVAALAPASGNVYQCITQNANPNGTTTCVIQQLLKGATAYANYQVIVYEGKLSQFIAENDTNQSAISVRFVGPDGVQKVMDAQAFLNTLL